MQFNKSYKLLRFLNRRHGIASRYSLATLGWLGALATTRSFVLARALAGEFLEDHYDLAFRKAARHARHVSSRFDLFNDPFFDFTKHTTTIERHALRRDLERLKNALPEDQYLGDLLYVAATDIHELLRDGIDTTSQIKKFYDIGNQALNIEPDLIEHTATSNRTRRASPEDFNREHATTALRDIADVLPNNVWPWYIISGTFLGLHREGGFLAHDYDIDLGINAEDINFNRLLKLLRSAPKFVVKKIDEYIEISKAIDGTRSITYTPSIIKLIHENGLQVDLFIHYTEGGVCWHGSSIHRWNNTPFHLIKRDFEGVNVLTPADPDLYLTENYGAWEIPVMDFECTTGTPNLVIAPNYISLALFIKRYLYFKKHDSIRAEKLLAILKETNIITLDKHNHITLTQAV